MKRNEEKGKNKKQTLIFKNTNKITDLSVVANIQTINSSVLST